MRVHGLMVVAAGALALSGCASQRSNSEISRLRNDIGILDQRLAQLERSSVGGATSWGAESASTAMVTPSAQPLSSAAKPSKKEIQQSLKNAGYYQGTIDGKIGPQTREAVRAFQQANGLKVDGVVGRQTWEKLAPFLDVSAAPATEVSSAESSK